MKARIWVLSTVLSDENAPAMPAVFADEAEARTKYDEAIRAEWDSCMDQTHALARHAELRGELIEHERLFGQPPPL